MLRKIKLVSAILLLFLVTGSCSKDDNSGGGGAPQPQASPAGMGSQAISASAAVAGPLISLINNIPLPPAPPATAQSSTQAFGDRVSPKQLEGSFPIPCEQGTFVTVTPTIDPNTSLPTEFTVSSPTCITSDGTVTLQNLNAVVTNLVFSQTPTLCNDQSVFLPLSMDATINGSFTETQNGTSVDFAMNNLGMAFSDIVWRPSDCSITDLTDKVTGVITTSLQGQTVTLNYGTGSLTFIVQVNTDVVPAEVTISVSGDMTVNSPCYNGTFHIETDPDVPIKIVEGQIFPVEGKVTLTRVSGDPFPDTTLNFADPATRNLPVCIGILTGGGGGAAAGEQHRVTVKFTPNGGGNPIEFTTTMGYECTGIADSPCQLAVFDAPGDVIVDPNDPTNPANIETYVQYLDPVGPNCGLAYVELTDPDSTIHYRSFNGSIIRNFGAFDPSNSATLTPFVRDEIATDSQGNTGTLEFFEFDQGSGDFAFQGFKVPRLILDNDGKVVGVEPGGADCG